MKTCIFVLLVFSRVGLGQPVEGPYVVIESDSAIHHIHVAARNDSIADVFWQVGNDAYHAAMRLTDGAVYAGPEGFSVADSGYVRTLEDAVSVQSGWRIMAYDLATEFFSSTIYSGTDSLGALTAFYEGRTWCPDNLYLCCSHYNSHFAFSSHTSRIFLNWQDSWSCHWMWGWEGGTDYTYVRFDGGDPAPVTPFAFQGPVEGRAFALSPDTVLDIGWSPYGLAACTTSTQSCAGISAEINCQVAPMEFLLTTAGRCLALCEARHDDWWDVDQRFVELNFGEGTCTDLLTLDANPIASASHLDYGLAWLSRPDNGLLLNRADTTGTLVSTAGVVYWPEDGEDITGSNIAIADNGKVMVVWTTQHAGSDSTQLSIEAVDWETPLATNPGPERTAVRRYELDAYPNPFNPETKLSFSLPRSGQVSLVVYDVTGRRVRTVVDRVMDAGEHIVTFDGSGLPSGLYLVRLAAGSVTQTKKMVLLR